MERDGLGAAMNVLAYLSDNVGPVGVRALSQALDMSVGRSHRILQALLRQQLVIQDAERGGYRISLKVVELAGKVLRQFDVRAAALPILRSVRDKTGESSALMVREGTDRVCLMSVESEQTLRIVILVGARGPLYCGASGRVLLAFQPTSVFDEVVSAGLKPLTSNTITDPSQLLAKVKAIRREGFAISHGERQADVSSLAVPVYRNGGEVIAALAFFGPSSRCSDRRLRQFVPLLRRSASEITRLMAGHQLVR